MSDIWAYEILLPRPVRADDVARTVQVAEERGYTPINPESGMASVMTLDGMEVHEFTNPATLETALPERGGSVQIWKGEIDLSITIYPASSQEIEPMFDPAPRGWSRISISVDGSFFRDEAMRTAVAADTGALFSSSCEQLSAAYGLSRDEAVTETFLDAEQLLPSAVAKGSAPPMLFWLNYFNREHFQWIDEELFSRIGSWVTSTDGGVLVSVFDRPWEISLDALRDVNRRWREVSAHF